jgi:hypothetical protein
LDELDGPDMPDDEFSDDGDFEMVSLSSSPHNLADDEVVTSADEAWRQR